MTSVRARMFLLRGSNFLNVNFEQVSAFAPVFLQLYLKMHLFQRLSEAVMQRFLKIVVLTTYNGTTLEPSYISSIMSNYIQKAVYLL